MASSKPLLPERLTLRPVAVIGGGREGSPRPPMLYDRNAFPLFGAGLERYRLHFIFRSYLAKHLEQCALPACREIDLAELYSNAGKCCLDVESYVQAMQFFLKAGTDEDLLQILKIFEIPKTANLLVLDPEKISDLVLGIPWRIRFQCPMGYLGFICSYLLLTTREKGRRLLDEAEEHF